MQDFIRILQTKNNSKSISFTIPREIIVELGLKKGQYIKVSINEDNEIVLKPIKIEG